MWVVIVQSSHSPPLVCGGVVIFGSMGQALFLVLSVRSSDLLWGLVLSTISFIVRAVVTIFDIFSFTLEQKDVPDVRNLSLDYQWDGGPARNLLGTTAVCKQPSFHANLEKPTWLQGTTPFIFSAGTYVDMFNLQVGVRALQDVLL